MALHNSFVRELVRALDTVDEDTLVDIVAQVVSHHRVCATNALAKALRVTEVPPPQMEGAEDSASESDAETVVEVRVRTPAAAREETISAAALEASRTPTIEGAVEKVREYFGNARVGAEFREWLDVQTRECVDSAFNNVKRKRDEEERKAAGAMTRVEFDDWTRQWIAAETNAHIRRMSVAAEVEEARLADLDAQLQDANASRPRLPSVSSGGSSEDDAQERVVRQHAHRHAPRYVRVQPAQDNEENAQPVRRPIPRDTPTEKWRVRYRIERQHVQRCAGMTDAQVAELDFQGFSELHCYLGFARSTHVPPPKGDPWLLDARFRLDAIEQLFYNDRRNCRVYREIAAARKRSTGHRRGG